MKTRAAVRTVDGVKLAELVVLAVSCIVLLSMYVVDFLDFQSALR